MRRFFAARKRESDEPAQSSASSSSGSGSDHIHLVVLPTPKRTWKPWSAAKRTLSLKGSQSRPTLPDWSTAPPLPHSPSDDDYSVSSLASAPPDPHMLRPFFASTSRPPTVSPFVQHGDGPLFPRSINRCRRLPPPNDLRASLFRKHLAARIDASDVSPADLAVIAPLAAKTPPVALPSHTPSGPDISRPLNTTKIFPASPGLRRWIARPCFEHRYIVYTPSLSGIDSRPVSCSWAIAALEYSEHLDVMVDPDFDLVLPSINVPDTRPPLEPTLAATHSHASPADQGLVSAPAPSSRNSYTAIPSPLRNEHAAAAPTPPTPSVAPELTQVNPKMSTVKRIVRFVEDDSDDGVPLHIVRMKKKRDQKSNFLRQEQLKRKREEDEARRQREQEMQQAQQEALEMERHRLAIEKERKDREKAQYAEAVAAARTRREISRAGGVVSSNTTNSLLVPSPSFSSLKDSERNKSSPESRRYSRANHDAPPSISIPRREASEPVMHLNTPSVYPNKRFSDSSRDSSRPPSLAYSPVSPAQGHSRPPSTYSAHTSSSEDVRHQSGSKRNSLAPSAVAPSYARPPIIASYSSWSGSNPNLQYIPPVPPFPDFITDMPLLPPTAPFMKHSRPRSPSSSRKDDSSAPSSRRGSVNSSMFNSSSERIDLVSKGSGSSMRNSSSSSRPPQQRHASTPVKPMHERRNSGDSRTTHHTQRSRQNSQHQPSSRPTPVSSRSQPVVTRGRPEQPSAWAQPQFMQAMPMNPYMSGMPMAAGPPMMMPYMAVPVYPMMPMMSGSHTDLHNASMGTPRRDGGTLGRKAGDKRVNAVS